MYELLYLPKGFSCDKIAVVLGDQPGVIASRPWRGPPSVGGRNVPPLTPSLHSGQALTLSLEGRGDLPPRLFGERTGVRGSF